MIALVAAAAIAAAAPVLDELERLDRALVKAELRLQELEEERAGLVVEIAGLAAEQATAQVRRDEAYAGYARRLRGLARMPAGARAVLLGGTRSLAEYLEMQRVLRWLAAHDKSLHARYAGESRRIEAAKSRLAEREERLAAGLAEARAQRDALALTRQERAALVEGMFASRESALRTASEQRLAHVAVSGMLKRLVPAGRLSESFEKNRGRLPWPAAGAAGTGFGDTREARFGTTVSHPGLDILAKSGTPVQAVAAGTVVFADWLKGYGQIVIIDHGDEYHTLSAHLASARVRTGDPVVAGTLIGTVGDTGSLTGSHLYFELRRAGVPEDPQRWLRR